MRTPGQADLTRWSEEVARDPASLAFLPLARAYRRQGQRSAARDLCLRGLEHYPAHAEAHSLLALLYLEDGDRTKAADEWSMVLRMDPNHFEALRGIGFCYLEQDQLSKARQALERAALLRPQDAAVEEALKVLGTRQELHAGGAHTTAADDHVRAADEPAAPAPATASAPGSADEPWAASPSAASPSAASLSAASLSAAAPTGGMGVPYHDEPAPAMSMQTHSTPKFQDVTPSHTTPVAPVQNAMPAAFAPTATPPAASASASPTEISSDPSLLFESMTRAGPLLGVLLLDSQGLVMAGSLGDGAPGSAETLGATLGPAISEASRTVSLLQLGAWRGMLLEAGTAVLHVSPVTADAFVLLAAKRSAPTGWVLRSAATAVDLATRYVKEYA